MKGGSIPAWRKQSRREAGISPWRKRGFRRARGEPVWPGVERPCPAGIWSERVEAVGGGWSYYLDACGRLGRRDERTRACSAVYLSCARLGASRPPQSVQVETTGRREVGLHPSISSGRTDVNMNLRDGQLLERKRHRTKGGSKLFGRKITPALTQRTGRRTARLLRQSGLPQDKTFRTFHLARLSPTLQLQLERLGSATFLDTAINVIAIGKPGVGKSHALAAVGYELILAGQARSAPTPGTRQVRPLCLCDPG